MKLTTITHVSVDGVMQGPGGADEDRRGGFERGGWAGPLFDNEATAFLNQVFQRADAFLLGRWTYETFAGSWGLMTDSVNPIAMALNTRPKYVASTTPFDPTWANTTVLSGDFAAAIRELKAKAGGELQVHGSGVLVAARQRARRRDHPAHLSAGPRPGQATIPRHRPRHSARPGRLAVHPQRGDHPGLSARRAPAVRNGHGRLKHVSSSPQSASVTHRWVRAAA
jgi:dihydrofolate reductase